MLIQSLQNVFPNSVALKQAVLMGREDVYIVTVISPNAYFPFLSLSISHVACSCTLLPDVSVVKN